MKKNFHLECWNTVGECFLIQMNGISFKKYKYKGDYEFIFLNNFYENLITEEIVFSFTNKCFF